MLWESLIIGSIKRVGCCWMSSFWYLAFLEGSPDRKSGIVAGARARVVLAALLRSGWDEFELGLDKVAKEVGLAKTYFRKGVDDLVELEWLKKVPSVRGGQGSRYSVADVFRGEGSKKVAPWQESVAAKSLWGAEDTKAPGHESILLAVLALSSNEYGFVSTLSHSAIADHSGMETSTLIVMLKRLREKKLIEVFKGGSGKKIQGKGWTLTSVYQINPDGVLKSGCKIALITDHAYRQYVSVGNLYEWLRITSPFIQPYLEKDKQALLLSVRDVLPRVLPLQLIDNLYARSMIAASYLINSNRFRSGVKELIQGLKKCDEDTTVSMELVSIECIASAFNELVQLNMFGIDLRANEPSSTYDDFVKQVKSAIEVKDSGEPLSLLAFVVYSVAVYLAVDRCIAIDNSVLGGKDKSEHDCYAIHRLRGSADLCLYQLDTK